MTEKEKPTGLALMREPFPPHAISKLPKPHKWQTEALNKNKSLGVKCKECGQWHHKDVIHLDYVGHAALTDRLLDCDPEWNYDFVKKDEHGAPIFDENGGAWIWLKVCGVTRLGYGFADGKSGGNAIKEVIGDALRNAAMRFGAALDLWHKGELHHSGEDQDPGPQAKPKPEPEQKQHGPSEAQIKGAIAALGDARDEHELRDTWVRILADVKRIPEVQAKKDARKAELESQITDDNGVPDNVPF